MRASSIARIDDSASDDACECAAITLAAAAAVTTRDDGAAPTRSAVQCLPESLYARTFALFSDDDDVRQLSAPAEDKTEEPSIESYST